MHIVIGPFFFSEDIVTVYACVDMLHLFAVSPQHEYRIRHLFFNTGWNTTTLGFVSLRIALCNIRRGQDISGRTNSFAAVLPKHNTTGYSCAVMSKT